MKLNQNAVVSPLKLFNAPLQPSNLLSLILFFAFGLSFGILLTFHLKNVSFYFRFNEFPLSTTTTAAASNSSQSPPERNMGVEDFISPSKLNHNMTDQELIWRASMVPKVRNLSTTTAAAASNSSQSPPERNMGLEDFISPSKLNHNMTDQELIWRASMVPKVRKYPYNRIPKVAFMFLTRGPVLMSPLWERFFKGHNGLFTIYVHSSDLSSNWTEPKHSVFHGRKIPSKSVQWGKVNMIEAERRLLANALLDHSNQRFVLLSESCIPLFNFSSIYSYLINSNQNFVESYDLKGPVGRGRYSHRMYPTIELREWRKGSQWFEMDRDLALEVISDTTYFPVFQSYCDHSCYADEHYLPTFVTKKFGARNSGRTLTSVDWSKGGSHPARYMRNDVTQQFLEKLRNSNHCEYNGRKNQTCHLFARKFTPHSLNRLLRFAPRVMQFNP